MSTRTGFFQYCYLSVEFFFCLVYCTCRRWVSFCTKYNLTITFIFIFLFFLFHAEFEYFHFLVWIVWVFGVESGKHVDWIGIICWFWCTAYVRDYHVSFGWSFFYYILSKRLVLRFNVFQSEIFPVFFSLSSSSSRYRSSLNNMITLR